MTADRARHQTKQAITTYLTLPEEHRLRALAQEHYHVTMTHLIRRLVLAEIGRTADLPLTHPHPPTVPTTG